MRERSWRWLVALTIIATAAIAVANSLVENQTRERITKIEKREIVMDHGCVSLIKDGKVFHITTVPCPVGSTKEVVAGSGSNPSGQKRGGGPSPGNGQGNGEGGGQGGGNGQGNVGGQGNGVLGSTGVLTTPPLPIVGQPQVCVGVGGLHPVQVNCP